MFDVGDICKKLSVVYGVLSAIGDLIISFTYGKIGGLGMGIVMFLTIGLTVAMITAALYAIGGIYETVNSIRYGTREILDLSTKATSDERNNSKIMANGGWKCPKCGKVNNSYETSCICGQSKN